MRRYRIITKNGAEILISGWLTVYKKHYLIISENDKENYYPKSKTIINEL